MNRQKINAFDNDKFELFWRILTMRYLIFSYVTQSHSFVILQTASALFNYQTRQMMLNKCRIQAYSC